MEGDDISLNNIIILNFETVLRVCTIARLLSILCSMCLIDCEAHPQQPTLPVERLVRGALTLTMLQ